ncbi:hypothetical protein CLOM_g15939, partial [Closterium sp. NIES-68]
LQVRTLRGFAPLLLVGYGAEGAVTVLRPAYKGRRRQGFVARFDELQWTPLESTLLLIKKKTKKNYDSFCMEGAFC